MTNYLAGATKPKDGMLRQWALRCRKPVTFEWLAYGVATKPDGGGDVQNPPSAWKTRGTRTNRQLSLLTAA